MFVCRGGSQSCVFSNSGALFAFSLLLLLNFFSLTPEIGKVGREQGSEERRGWRGDNRCAPSFRELLV